jgi:hypothetical protein
MTYTASVKEIYSLCLDERQELSSRGKNSLAGQGDFIKSEQIVKLNIKQIRRRFDRVRGIDWWKKFQEGALSQYMHNNNLLDCLGRPARTCFLEG